MQISIRLGEHVQNGDHSDAHHSTFSHSSKEVSINVRIETKPLFAT